MKVFGYEVNIDSIVVVLLIFVYFLLGIIYRMRGIKVIVFTVYNDYFFEMFLPVYVLLKNDSRLRVFFSYPLERQGGIKSLHLHVKKRYIGVNPAVFYLKPDLCITGEVHQKDLLRHCKNGCRAQIFHGIGVYNLYALKDLLGGYDVYFSINPEFTQLIKWIYKDSLKKYRLYEVGFPKLDVLFDDAKSSKGDEKVVLYAPHWTDYGSLKKYGLEIIKHLSLISNVKLVVKLHNQIKYHDPDLYKKIKDYCEGTDNVAFSLVANTSLLVVRSDLVVTDVVSSIGFEAFAANKPCVIYNDPSWFKDYEHTEVESEMLKFSNSFISVSEAVRIVNQIVNKGYFGKTKLIKKDHDKIVEKFLYNPGNGASCMEPAIYAELNLL